MMNFEKINEKICSRGFRKPTAAHNLYNESTDTMIKCYDYEHPKKDDMVSVYLDENESVLYVEYTRQKFDYMSGWVRQVTKIDNAVMLNKMLG